jgi:hypothetical protein
MEPAVNQLEKTITAPERAVKCAFCRDQIPLADAVQTAGVCKLCVSEFEEFGWRTVYDREQKVGQIPSNLRAAYKL